jgi:hypothetical protein
MRTILTASAGLAVATCLAVACSSSDTPPAATPPAAGDAGPGSDSGIATPGDAAADAPAPTKDLPCLGDGAPMVLAKNLPYAKVKIGAPPNQVEGDFLVDYGTTATFVDLAAFPIPPKSTGCDPSKTGQTCTFDAFDFFGPWGSVQLVTSDYAGIPGPPRQAGILGTDFTSAVAITLDYPRAKIRRALKEQMCPDAALVLSGFAAVSTLGFFSNDANKLKGLSDVVAGAPFGVKVPNVPTIDVRIAGTASVAQLDTGFADTFVPYSVNVNEPLLTAMQAKNPGSITRSPGKDLALTTCVVGVQETVEAYDLAPGKAAEILGADGTVVRRYNTAVVFVKKPPAAAKVCGGIGTWTAPAAQIGASFFAEAGVTVLDPLTSRVWISKDQ